jgi:tetracycline resistance efflux pump
MENSSWLIENYEWLKVLPPVAAIVLAILSRQVILSLFFGIWMGWTLLAGGNPVAGVADALAALIDVFKDSYNTKVILFSALVGSLITLTQRSGGVQGFVNWMHSLKIGQTHRSAGMVAWVTGLVVFVESSITCLVVGAVARPLADRVKMSREKLAYLCDSTSAPVCILIPLNAWGAYIMGLLAAEGIEKPLPLLVQALPLNFYAWLALGLALFVALTGWDIGLMKKAERRAREEGKLLADGAIPMISTEVIAMPTKEGVTPRRRNMLAPLLTMILMMPIGLYITGRSAILAKQEAGEAVDFSFFNMLGEGSGSTAVFWAVMAAITLAGVMYLIQRIFSLHEIMDLVLKGAGGLMPMAVIMMLAFAIGGTCKALGTGVYVAEVASGFLQPGWVPAVLFLVSCFIAFSTGTSWGTFGIMMPIAVPLVLASGGSLPMSVAAIMGGGVFGDHCSPISDTTVISSMATASDHIDHVKTQLPYALLAAVPAFILYAIFGRWF